ncbi:isoamyl alcohol oxidase [Talaromyces stipitatus ATCC 10500]|uniref:Isoamyl alcohol oxidase n=1 Tax=Talaromyces stipitatus (strain ATCC 10500 / CBS 375.48 / QM 6759 / NRRL 1006) TaxID=441959 RepID=B8LYV6_TALSN|nr:isoamyl alcohol oxidase [Talaromyces stipitatus ATCC 10500]EED23464.1 isoamyl alcohol oxidase [Talaromyces stipitatus ATCC 10500]
MSSPFIALMATGILYAGIGHAGNATCKCMPNDACWPSPAIWSTLNDTLSGKLIQNIPVAAPCYPGPYSNPTECAIVQENWMNTSFLSEYSIGYSYPFTQSCDIAPGNTTNCELGDSPVYAVNASTPEDAVAGVNFAREWNLRLVVKTTGHDMLGRSTGYGSLEIWLRYLRQGISFEEVYSETLLYGQNEPAAWNGSAIEVGAGYDWGDVNAVAAANGVIVVGGGCPSVGVLGGFTQGGGHSRATHDFGLAADQLLEAQVVLTNGEQVLANRRSNVDLFRALRGGGGGTYGIVTTAKIKAYPDAAYTAQSFYMAPLSTSHDDLVVFMEVIAILYEAFPALADDGLSGYGAWSAYNVGESINASMTYIFAAREKTVAEIEAMFAPILEKLLLYNGTNIELVVSYMAYDGYWDYYYGLGGGTCSAATTNSALVSRLFTKVNLSNDGEKLRKMLNNTVGTPSEGVVNGFALLGGGPVSVSDTFSGVNPAWRKSYMHNYCTRGWSDDAEYETVMSIHHDLTYSKGGALREFAPDTGAYMNEADWQDPWYLQDFYGENLPVLTAAKIKFDPDEVLYCPTCVGSERWTSKVTGALCRAP